MSQTGTHQPTHPKTHTHNPPTSQTNTHTHTQPTHVPHKHTHIPPTTRQTHRKTARPPLTPDRLWACPLSMPPAQTLTQMHTKSILSEPRGVSGTRAFSSQLFLPFLFLSSLLQAQSPPHTHTFPPPIHTHTHSFSPVHTWCLANSTRDWRPTQRT